MQDLQDLLVERIDAAIAELRYIKKKVYFKY